MRADLVRLLATGHAAIPILEALDQRGLLVQVLPEWEPVRSRPQRNAYHRFTVDRHLCEAAANAAGLADRVSRPDLLLLGTWLHDIGKGHPGDHTEVGIELVGRIGRRMGLPPADVETLVAMVRHHLLLPDVATRRDLDDPATIEGVAKAVGGPTTLELLDALTEADSLATGPSAWSEWKAGLVKELADKTFVRLFTGSDGRRLRSERTTLEPPAGIETGLVGDGNRCTIVGIDRPGLFANVAGVLALHGLDVRSASVGSAADGRAVEMIDVEPAFGRAPRWDRVAADLDAVLEGRLALDEKLAERHRAYERRYRRTAARPADPRVLFDNDASRRATVVEVRAPDGVAVLYRITSALSAAGLDVRVARISTLGHEVVDAFYVVGPDRRKVTDPETLAAVEAAILEQLSADYSARRT
jgi:[protein-PII] uridylyltransferase